MAWKTKQHMKDTKWKYNFDKLKIEFFKDSEYNELKSFFENRYKTYNSYIRNNTVGWVSEKKEMIKTARILAQKEIAEELKNLYKPSEKELAEMHKAVMQIFKWKLYNVAKQIKTDPETGGVIIPDDLDIREQEIIHKIIKQEMVDLKIIDEKDEENKTIQTIRII